MADHHSPIRTLILYDPEGHDLGRLISSFVPDVGDTIRCKAWDTAFDGTTDVAGEVVHREWNDAGIVRVTIEPL